MSCEITIKLNIYDKISLAIELRINLSISASLRGNHKAVGILVKVDMYVRFVIVTNILTCRYL